MNKDFEAIEKIAISMVEIAWPDYNHASKVAKLKEEISELMEVLHEPLIEKQITNGRTVVLSNGNILSDCQLDMVKVQDEMADVLFVLLHIANRLGFSGKDLLHHATTKLLRRVNDPCYNKK